VYTQAEVYYHKLDYLVHQYMNMLAVYTQAQVLHTLEAYTQAQVEVDNMAQAEVVLHILVEQAEAVAQAEYKSAEVDNMVQEQEYTLALDLANCKQVQVLHTLAQVGVYKLDNMAQAQADNTLEVVLEQEEAQVVYIPQEADSMALEQVDNTALVLEQADNTALAQVDNTLVEVLEQEVAQVEYIPVEVDNMVLEQVDNMVLEQVDNMVRVLLDRSRFVLHHRHHRCRC
jgi:hypothetical protein